MAYIKNIGNNIYAFIFDNHYDLGMTFLRYQEFYESPYSQFYRKQFNLIDYMEFYAKNQSDSNCFSYPSDYSGYNFPDFIFPEAYPEKENKYDVQMLELYTQAKIKSRNNKFYIIGCVEGEEDTLIHEIAHALFYLENEYRKEMGTLIKKIPNKHYNTFKDILKENMYRDEVMNDEIQAYLATGVEPFEEDLNRAKFPIKSNIKRFSKVFAKYYKAND